mmetsp:Transcript_16795/g.54933  ORF Transcript_16795/g.54933 Transcript_16795/m.54933 type:complete len:256 (+) Transcript_16795:936-1703(+)
MLAKERRQVREERAELLEPPRIDDVARKDVVEQPPALAQRLAFEARELERVLERRGRVGVHHAEAEARAVAHDVGQGPRGVEEHPLVPARGGFDEAEQARNHPRRLRHRRRVTSRPRSHAQAHPGTLRRKVHVGVNLRQQRPHLVQHPHLQQLVRQTEFHVGRAQVLAETRRCSPPHPLCIRGPRVQVTHRSGNHCLHVKVDARELEVSEVARIDGGRCEASLEDEVQDLGRELVEWQRSRLLGGVCRARSQVHC